MSKTRRNISPQSQVNGRANGTNGRLHINRIEDLFTPPTSQEKIPELDLSIKQVVSARTPNQKLFLKSIRDNDITFCTGEAGTGKTHLSMGYAATALYKGTASKIILVRPAVSCDEKLGFVPGDLMAKLDSFLIPSYDELLEFYTPTQLNKLMGGRFPIITGAPLGQIKGRTFKNAVVVLDEAQDATYRQLKNFLTRMGENTKIIVTGDITQSDTFDYPEDTALYEVMGKMDGAVGVGFVRMTPADGQRHPRTEQILERL